MRRTYSLVGLMVFALVSGIAQQANAAEGGIEEIDARWMKAFKANDLDAVVACYAPDAIGWFPNAPMAKGADAIRESYMQFFSAHTITDVALSDAHYATVGDRSVGWGQFTLTLIVKATGKTQIMTGRFTEVGERRDGKWVYIVDHVSPEPVPTAPNQ